MKGRSYARGMADVTADGTATPSRARRRERATAETRAGILAAARTVLLQEAEGQTQLLRDLGVGQSRMPRSRCRAITTRWISDVPSPISQIFASRIMRSTG